MAKTDRKHHHIWQEYLKPWCNENKIYCLRDNRVFLANTDRVATVTNFYDIRKLNREDIDFIDNFFKGNSINYKAFIVPILNTFRNIIELNNFVKKEVNEELETLKDAIENIHSEYEQRGLYGLNQLRSNNITFFRDLNSEKTFDFLIYLSFQYLRTNRMVANISYVLKDKLCDYKSAYHIITLCLTISIAAAIRKKIEDKELNVTLLYSLDECHFVTGDQPVINLLAEYEIDKEVENMHLYYPITPEIALIIDSEHSKECQLNKEEVERFNNIIYKFSLENIFGDNKEYLEKIKRL